MFQGYTSVQYNPYTLPKISIKRCREDGPFTVQFVVLGGSEGRWEVQVVATHTRRLFVLVKIPSLPSQLGILCNADMGANTSVTRRVVLSWSQW